MPMHRLSFFRLAPILPLLLPALSCGGSSEGSDGTPGSACQTNADCDPSLDCIDGRCTARMPPPSDAGAEDATDAACTPPRIQCAGACCEEGERCLDEACCPESNVCGGACCQGEFRTCVDGRCELRCPMNRAVCGAGEDAICCEAGDVCLLGECLTPGAACDELTRCPEGQYCEPTLGRCLPRRESGEACTWRPPPGAFEPVVEWQWSGDPAAFPQWNQVMMAPMVAQLTDDDGDGDIDERDVPDVVFHTFTGSSYSRNGIMRAISGADGSRIWPAPGADPGYRVNPGSGIAIGDIDPDSPGPEIVTCSSTVGGSGCCDGVAGDVIIVRADGTLLRRLEGVACGYDAPALADVNGDGVVEIAVRFQLVEPDGTVLFRDAARAAVGGGPGSATVYPALADLDGDGDLEFVAGGTVYQHDGTVLWNALESSCGRPAVADLDTDGQPEVVFVDPCQHAVSAYEADGTRIWGPVDVNQGQPTPSGPSGGGPPTIADFDGDGRPEVATAGGYGYLVLNGEDGSTLWFDPNTQDTSSRSTGSSVFDFDGDGAAEVVYNDELRLRVYDGRDGTVLLDRCNTSGTLWEYPLVVDVDGDEQAEIVVMANNYAFQCPDAFTGIRVYGDRLGRWVRTRKVWNQHTYHVTNVEQNGTIPRNEPPNWSTPGLNNFRQNVQPEGLLDAPDLVTVDLALTPGSCGGSESRISFRLYNRGRAGAPAGIPVLLYLEDPSSSTATPFATVTSSRRLLPGESELLSAELPMTLSSGESITVWLVINGGDGALETLHECREDNNTATETLQCPTLG